MKNNIQFEMNRDFLKPIRNKPKTNFYQKLAMTNGYEFTNQQKDIIQHTKGYSQVLATAGSGKTTTITAKIGWAVLESGVNPKSILALSFSKESAKDFKRRYEDMFCEDVFRDVSFSTIHSFAYKVMKEHAIKTSGQFKLIQAEDVYKFLAEAYNRLNHKFATKEVIEKLIGEIGFVNNAMIEPSAYRAETKNFLELFTNYERMKKENHFIDFDDMLIFCYEILSKDKNFLRSYETRYPYVLLDEAQDVNKVQALIIELLTANNKNLTIIGDDDQSIYRFRAADPSYLIEFASKHHGTVVFDLGMNYRCPPNIVSDAVQLIEYNKVRLEKDIKSSKEYSGDFEYISYKDQEDQYTEVLKRLKDLGSEELKDTAILFRNNDSMVPFLDMLYREGMPIYIKDDKVGFFNHWALRDITDIMKFFDNRTDLKLLLKILPKLSIYLNENEKNATVNELECKGDAVEIVLSHLNEKNYNKFKKLRNGLDGLTMTSIPSLVDQILYSLEYQSYIDYRGENGDFGTASAATVIGALKYISKDIGSINELLRKLNELTKVISQMKYSKKGSGVSLITLHSSKGLEFKNVMIVDMIKNLFPSKSSMSNVELLEEERRLCYVGVTRASENLFIFYQEDKKSEFIDELKGVKKVQKTVIPDLFRGKYMPKKNEKTKCHPAFDSEGTLIKDMSQLDSNMNIVHQKFGDGVVKGVDESILEIEFDEMGTKKLSVKHIIMNELLKIKMY